MSATSTLLYTTVVFAAASGNARTAASRSELDTADTAPAAVTRSSITAWQVGSEMSTRKSLP